MMGKAYIQRNRALDLAPVFHGDVLPGLRAACSRCCSAGLEKKLDYFR